MVREKKLSDRPALEEREWGHNHISNNPHVFRRIFRKSRPFMEEIKIFRGFSQIPGRFYRFSHPYAPLTVGVLSDAVGIYHSNPVLYYIPKQEAIKDFDDEFGNELYMIEERTADGHGDLESFGYII